MDSNKKQDGKLLHLELLRIIACFLVILNHTSGYINCFVYDKDYITLELILKLFVGMLVKINVPLFFMITGSVLLYKDRDYGYVCKKVLKTFGILLLFSIVANFCNQGHIYVTGFIRCFITESVDGAGPYWYLYAYLGLLLILPFMRSVAARLTVKDLKYIIIARTLITGIIPMAFLFVNKIMDSNIQYGQDFNPVLFTFDCVFYPIIGFGLDRLLEKEKVDKLNPFSFILLFLGANVTEIFLTWIGGLDKVYRGYDFLMAIGIFMLIKILYSKREEKEPGKIGSFIATVGGLTFGIYLLDPILDNYIDPLIVGPKTNNLLFLRSVVYCIVSMIIGGLITFVFKKIKKNIFFKK
ncbi:hypothetical protein D6853_06135 [Butyrivibrio sp. X503]|uniref:acyltransferase family protein n=1 Tax=Butyrivibrio sp. X503 TaxID=2364878 RepID=UPI000EAA3073|nr:acyltransferase [Butyrivibrio sp. X503]RKM56368.1 hypothetical protein D6853_06135 [Butyrivibrio sp. X503]